MPHARESDGLRPDRYGYLGAAICLVGVAVLMFAREQLPDPELLVF